MLQRQPRRSLRRRSRTILSTGNALGLTDSDKRFFQSRLEKSLLGLKSVDQVLSALAPTENPRNEKRALPRSSISSVVKSADPGIMFLYTLTLWDHIGAALTTRDGVK